MTFKPNTRDLETMAIMGHARAPASQIAAALGITPEEFSAWASRLALGRAWSVLPPRAATRVLDLATVTNPRIAAERLFEGDPASDGTLAAVTGNLKRGTHHQGFLR